MYLWKLTRREERKTTNAKYTRAGTNQPNESKVPPCNDGNHKPENREKTNKNQRRKNKKEEREKFEINLQIQPFDFEKSCAKYQNIFGYIKKSILKLRLLLLLFFFASLFVGRKKDFDIFGLFLLCALYFSGALFPAAYGKRKIFLFYTSRQRVFLVRIAKNQYCVRFNILKYTFCAGEQTYCCYALHNPSVWLRIIDCVCHTHSLAKKTSYFVYEQCYA